MNKFLLLRGMGLIRHFSHFPQEGGDEIHKGKKEVMGREKRRGGGGLAARCLFLRNIVPLILFNPFQILDYSKALQDEDMTLG